MKNKIVFMFAVANLSLAVCSAQTSLPTGVNVIPSTGTGIGINTGITPYAPLDIRSSNTTLTSNSLWPFSIRLLPETGQNKGGSILFDKGNLGAGFNNYFMAGPSSSPAGDYYTGLTEGNGLNNYSSPSDYVYKVYGSLSGGGTIPQGTTQYYHNVVLAGGTQPNLSLGIRTTDPKQAMHLDNGAFLISQTTAGDQGLYFKNRANLGTASFGDWGIQYNVGTGAAVGLNFWKPSGSTGGFANYCLFLKDNGNIGINTGDPSAKLHVNTGGAGVRLEGLTASAATRTIVSDINGNLYYQNGVPLSNGCTTTNYVPRMSGANSTTCSQIWDNGTSVCINSTTPRTFLTAGTYASVVGAPVNSTVARLDVNGLTFTNSLVVSSDKRFKQDIKPLESSLEKIMNLTGVSYNWNSSAFPDRNFDGMPQIGFLAQEVEKVIPEAVMIDNEGFYAMNYNMIIPVIASAVKEQQLQLLEKDEAIASLKVQLESLIQQQQEMIQALSECCSNFEASVNTTQSNVESARLEQNRPNPFSEKTTIKYFVPTTFSKAQLAIYSIGGEQVKTFNITSSGMGQIEFDGNTFTNGTYIYTLIIDGAQVDSKWMTLTK